MKTIKNPKRIPRKLKKEVIKKFGRESYKKVLVGDMFIQPKIISYLNDNKFRNKFIGWSLWSTIK